MPEVWICKVRASEVIGDNRKSADKKPTALRRSGKGGTGPFALPQAKAKIV